MKHEEQSLADEKMRAEIAKLFEEIPHIRTERRQIIINMILAPLFAGAAIFGAGVAAMKYLF